MKGQTETCTIYDEKEVAKRAPSYPSEKPLHQDLSIMEIEENLESDSELPEVI